ncbi:hypothetical protein ebA462 [Aromatoleum aromaticum EbN1]|uniref:Uncharacterized protein n=1 Tax=Aromatoleum aromaticum (strain DSM 19018 / LMG 30748 / EbN1) TaxID=76114 RepID=Q5P8K1_AROAE|nr:hypothetical protein ebA462 [Aromatoleum aromaticum EbN1]
MSDQRAQGGGRVPCGRGGSQTEGPSQQPPTAQPQSSSPVPTAPSQPTAPPSPVAATTRSDSTAWSGWIAVGGVGNPPPGVFARGRACPELSRSLLSSPASSEAKIPVLARVTSNPSIERTATSKLRLPSKLRLRASAAQVERWASGVSSWVGATKEVKSCRT